MGTVLPDFMFFDNKPTLITLQMEKKILEVLQIKKKRLPGDKLWTVVSAILVNASKIKKKKPDHDCVLKNEE